MEKRKEPQNSYQRWMSLLVTLAITISFWLSNVAQSKPCIEQTTFFGPQTSTNYTELYVDEDDSTRIIAMKYCAFTKIGSNPDLYQHFRGFEATIQSDTNTFVQTYGTLDETAADTKCESFQITEEIMYIQIFSDSNDIEGLIVTGHLGTKWTMRANGDAQKPNFKMPGRPLGFGIFMGQGGTQNQPLRMSIMYNGCNCPASRFTTEQQPRDMVTKAVSGPADVANLEYQQNYMEQIYEQNCGTYTVKLSPTYSFLTIAKTGATAGANSLTYFDQLTLVSNNPLDIGQYGVLMTVSQEPANGDGFGNPYIGMIPAISYDFLVTINPCTTSVSVNSPSNKITYTIGDNTLTDGTYSFTQTPDCGYIVFVDLTNLPAHVLHQKNSKDFRIPKTEDRSLEGTVTVNVKGYVSEPDDYTATTFTQKADNFNFDIEMVDPCPATVLQPFAINDMQIEVFGPAQVQTVTLPIDSIALNYGDHTGETFCGNKRLTITSVSPSLPAYTEFLSFDTATWTFTALTTQANHQGVYTIIAEIEMLETALGVAKIQTSFQLTILACQVSNMFKTPVDPQLYNVYTPKIDFDWDDFNILPCTYGLDYSYALLNTATGTSVPIPGPTMLTQANLDRTFEVYSVDALDVGVYQIIVTGTTEAGKMVPRYSEDLQIQLTVQNGCLNDPVSPVIGTSIPDIEYIIDDTGPLPFSPTWTTTSLGCPMTYEIRRLDTTTNVQSALTPYETPVITFDSSDGSLVINKSNDYKYTNETWTIQVFKRNTFGDPTNLNRDGIHQFEINFIDKCWLATFTGAQMNQPHYTFELYAYELMQGTQPTVKYNGVDVDCNGLTYDLTYLSGPLIDAGISHTSVYTLTPDPATKTIMLDGTPVDMAWLGLHTYQLKSTNGQFVAGSNRGQQGLYNSEVSTFTVTILDPCVNSIVNELEGIWIGDIKMPSNSWSMGPKIKMGHIDGSGSEALYTTPVLDGPKDSVAVRLGDGYNRCDYLTYAIQDASQQPIDSSGIVTVVPTRNRFAKDYFAFSVFNFPGGYLFTDELWLRISLERYDKALHTMLPFKVSYRTCRPHIFQIYPIPNEVYYVGESSRMILYELDQAPCNYEIGYYNVVMVTLEGVELPLPKFITSGTPESPKIWYQTTEASDAGKYRLRCYGSILRRGQIIDMISTDFYIDVLPIIKSVSPNDANEPQWDIGLEDRAIEVEDSMLYPVDIIDTPWGQEMLVTPKLGTAKDFLYWDDDIDAFVIHEGAALEEFVGDHYICLNVAYFNETYHEEYDDCFTMTINGNTTEAENQTIVANQTWVPPEKPEYKPPPVNQFVISDQGLDLAPFNERQPIPYIADLSITGVLTIAWDRKMTPRDDFEEINPSRVAVRDKSDIELAEKQVVDSGQAIVLQNDEGFRRLAYRHEELVKNETTLTEEWMLVVEALELRMNPGDYSDENLLNLTWQMKDFNKETIQMQLHFDYPERVSEYIEFDQLEVYFWGVDWFKSDRGEPVRYGTKLNQPILRQIDPKLAQWLGMFGHILATLTALIMLCAALLTGRLLPTWVFLEALQLISHLSLLKTQIPALAAYFMSQFLDLSRLNLVWPLFKGIAIEHGHFKEGALNMTFESYGYASLYIGGNMPVVLIAATVIFGLWVVSLAKGFVVKSTNHAIIGGVRDIFLLKRHPSWLVNFAVRFLYEMFLIVCISCMISLSKESQENLVPEYNEVHDPEANHAKYDIAMAYGLLVISLSALVFVFYRFFKTYVLKFKVQKIKFRKVDICAKFKECIEALRKRPARDTDDEKVNDSQQVPLKQVYENSLAFQDDRSQVIQPLSFNKLVDLPEIVVPEESAKPAAAEPKIVIDRSYKKPGALLINDISDQQSKEKKENDIVDKDSIFKSSADDGDKESGLEISQSEEESSDLSDIFDGRKGQVREPFKAPFEESVIEEVKKIPLISRNQQYVPPSANNSNARVHIQANHFLSSLRGHQYEGGQAIKKDVNQSESSSDFDDVLDIQKDEFEQAQKVIQQKAFDRISKERHRQHVWPTQHPFTKTLGYGLNVGHEDSMVYHYTLIFLLRRFVLAMTIVFAHDNVSIGVSMFLAFIFANFSMHSMWNLWDDDWIALQHFVNECFLGVIGLILLVISNGFQLRYGQIDMAGWVIVFLIVAFIVFNAVMLVYDAYRLLRLHVIRMRNIVEYRRQRYTISQVNKVTEQAQAHLYQLALEGAFQKKKAQVLRQTTLKARSKTSNSSSTLKTTTLSTTQTKTNIGSQGDQDKNKLSPGKAMDGHLGNELKEKDDGVKAAPILVPAKTKAFSNDVNTRTIQVVQYEFIEPPETTKVAQKDANSNYRTLLAKDKVKDEFEQSLEAIENKYKEEDLLAEKVRKQQENLDAMLNGRRNSRSSNFYLHSNLHKPAQPQTQVGTIGHTRRVSIDTEIAVPGANPGTNLPSMRQDVLPKSSLLNLDRILKPGGQSPMEEDQKPASNQLLQPLGMQFGELLRNPISTNRNLMRETSQTNQPQNSWLQNNAGRGGGLLSEAPSATRNYMDGFTSYGGGQKQRVVLNQNMVGGGLSDGGSLQGSVFNKQQTTSVLDSYEQGLQTAKEHLEHQVKTPKIQQDYTPSGWKEQ